jgi:hypothetical protein
MLTALIDADVVWHVPMLGKIRGRDELLRWLGDLFKSEFWLTEHDVFANDEHLCALSIMGATRGETDV